MNQYAEQLRALTEIILDLDKLAYSLRHEVIEITSLFISSQIDRPASQQDISGGEIVTSNGLAISPAMAAMCADDFVRTITFIRGIYAAINDVRNQVSDKPVKVLYAGCGPYATLAVPLMTMFSSGELKFTLLDIHPESILSAKSIIDTLGLSDAVVSYEVQDAGSYLVNPDQSFDIILTETMQACLEAEPQVAITRHLLSEIPDAVLIPEEVRIELKFVDMNKEHVLCDLENNEYDMHQDRMSVGPVFVINRESIDMWEHISGNCLPGLNVQIPDTLESRYQSMLFTEICVYQGHRLKEYDSGLTCPKVLFIDKEIDAGETLQFYYELGAHPRLTMDACD